MAKTKVEIQRAYKEPLYAAGYKQKQIWVPREPESKKPVKMTRIIFIKKLAELTAGMDKAKLSGLLAELTEIIRARNKEVNTKKG
jgi:hypothetical protein